DARHCDQSGEGCRIRSRHRRARFAARQRSDSRECGMSGQGRRRERSVTTEAPAQAENEHSMSDVRATTLPAEAVRITTNSDTEPFWQHAKEGRLVALQCGACGHFRMPPTPFCPECRSTEKNWKELSGRGSVYSYAVIHGFPGIPDITLV